MAWSIFTDGGGELAAKGWAIQLLRTIGAPVTPGNVQFVYDWEKSEGGGGKFNPLNQGPVPGHPELTTTGSQFGGGAADFASWQAGLTGASDYLHMPAYAGVLSNLKNGNPVAARSALWASPWAASHYGYGANWANDPVPGGKAILPPPGTGSGGTPATTASADPGCLIPLPSFGVGPISLSGGCAFSKGEARALLGGILTATGGLIAFVGVAILVASGFKRSGALDKATTVIGILPGGAAASAGLRTAGRAL